MKIGVKTYNSEKFLKHFENKADFFEIMAIQKNDYSFLKKFSLSMVIHAEHQGFGTNIADISKKKSNLKSINFAIKLADTVNSRKIIVHPGAIKKENPNYSEENAVNFLHEINDDRILIENLPKKYKQPDIILCSTSKEVKTFIKKTKSGFCFDINHAIGYVNSFKGDYGILKEYIKLNPKHYHLGGQIINSEEEHLCFRNSNLDLKKIFKYIPKNAEITLETETDIKKVEDDVKIIREIIKNL